MVLHRGERGLEKCLNITLCPWKGKFFSTRCRSVAGLLKRMLPNVFLLKRYDEAFLSLCLYALISLLCMCFCVCLRVCDLVFTGQFNLLKIYVHPALPPALPQALNLSTAVCIFFCVCVCSSLCPSSPALDMVKLLLNYFCSLGTYFRSVEFSCVALTWLKIEGYREKKRKMERGWNWNCPGESWRVRNLFHAVVLRRAETCWANLSQAVLIQYSKPSDSV